MSEYMKQAILRIKIFKLKIQVSHFLWVFLILLVYLCSLKIVYLHPHIYQCWCNVKYKVKVKPWAELEMWKYRPFFQEEYLLKGYGDNTTINKLGLGWY